MWGGCHVSSAFYKNWALNILSLSPPNWLESLGVKTLPNIRPSGDVQKTVFLLHLLFWAFHSLSQFLHKEACRKESVEEIKATIFSAPTWPFRWVKYQLQNSSWSTIKDFKDWGVSGTGCRLQRCTLGSNIKFWPKRMKRRDRPMLPNEFIHPRIQYCFACVLVFIIHLSGGQCFGLVSVSSQSIIAMRASLVQWLKARLPRGRPGFNSRTMQSSSFWVTCHWATLCLGFLLHQRSSLAWHTFGWW